MKRLIFTLVGVSLLDEKKKLLGTGIGFERNLCTIQNQINIDAIIENNGILNDCKKQVLEKLKQENLRDNLTKFSAEIASLYKLEALNNGDDKVILIVSETPECAFSGIVIGKFIVYKLTEEQNCDSISFRKVNDVFSCGNVEIKIIEGLQVKKGREFASRGIKNLFTFVSNKIEEEGAFYDEVIFNITGGYKGTIPYLTLFGMLYQEREIKGKKIKPLIKYLYEESDDIITLPNFPIAFDLPTWRDYRGLIKTMELLEKKQAETLKKVLPLHISGLFDPQDSRYRLNPFGEELKNRYSEEKISLTPFGRGYLLLDRIKDGVLRAYLKGCINEWQHIWIGDKIPEMVEHQRGHTQRVLELAAEMLYPILEDENRKTFQNDVELAPLIGAIWLHDLGNSGERFKLNDQEYIIKGFPSLVRDFHNLITATILKEENQKIFPPEVEVKVGDEKIQKSVVENIETIIGNIKIISKYHRKWTPLTQDKVNEKGKYCIKLKKAIEDNKLQFLTALYRVLDACDTQIERTVDDAYIDTRKMVVNREVRILLEEKERLECNNEIQEFIKNFDKDKIKKCANINLDSLNGDLSWILKEGEDNKEKIDKYKEKIDKYADCINYIVGIIKTCPDFKVPDVVERWLSCLDQIFFKKRQPLHYEKHKGIAAVMILPEGRENNVYKFNILVIEAEPEQEEKEDNVEKRKKRLEKVICKDIINEYFEVKEVLDPFIRFKFSYQCYNQKPQIYKDYNDFENMPKKSGCID